MHTMEALQHGRGDNIDRDRHDGRHMPAPDITAGSYTSSASALRSKNMDTVGSFVSHGSSSFMGSERGGRDERAVEAYEPERDTGRALTVAELFRTSATAVAERMGPKVRCCRRLGYGRHICSKHSYSTTLLSSPILQLDSTHAGLLSYSVLSCVLVSIMYDNEYFGTIHVQ